MCLMCLVYGSNNSMYPFDAYSMFSALYGINSICTTTPKKKQLLSYPFYVWETKRQRNLLKVNSYQVIELRFNPRKTDCSIHTLHSTLAGPIGSEHKLLLHLEGSVGSPEEWGLLIAPPVSVEAEFCELSLKRMTARINSSPQFLNQIS